MRREAMKEGKVKMECGMKEWFHVPDTVHLKKLFSIIIKIQFSNIHSLTGKSHMIL